MDSYSGQQQIKQLEKRRGGYFYLELDAVIINQFEKKKSTRLICTIDDDLSFRCGLNHLGDGNFFIIIATKLLNKLEKQLGDTVNYTIHKDPDQLGVEMPEVLEVFLNQDSDLQKIYEALTDGKKRSLIYSINKIKNIDIQVQKIVDFLQLENLKMK